MRSRAIASPDHPGGPTRPGRGLRPRVGAQQAYLADSAFCLILTALACIFPSIS